MARSLGLLWHCATTVRASISLLICVSCYLQRFEDTINLGMIESATADDFWHSVQKSDIGWQCEGASNFDE